MIYVWGGAWALGIWALLNNFRRGRANVPPLLWWAGLPFCLVGGMMHAVSGSPYAGLAAGLLAALLVHLPAAARNNKKIVRKKDAPSYIGRQGVVTRPLYSLDKGRINLEGRVRIDSDRNVYAITVGTTEKVEIPKGGRVRIVGHDGGDRLVVEPLENFAAGYLLH
ncbi:NfeD family protein [Arthrobacter sp. zg-Y820]|uniref:NfeD family protein n=1 Tax=unclassified Arthrobacter TaxID=235627 RepID=UPI001E3E0336|nr:MULTISPECIES: NfeD family protein [unclassified Arthrobacter]MCC9195737.1 NfeD family protein [Arthrobacter sp. zg-Y820]MDK1278596.1 NfeD family protein [Arthrobacter sp. zg.Y820]WIB08971.1 NfeD family protein [Arthrobacter sp. zg-Y820]